MARIPLSLEVLPIDRPLISPFIVGEIIPRLICRFVLAVSPSWTFEEVCRSAEDAYKNGYNEGKVSDWRFARITTTAPHFDIDMRYTVEELCADKRSRRFVIHTAPTDRQLSLPPDSTLSIPPPPPPHKRTFQDTQSRDEAAAADDDLKSKKPRTANRGTSTTALNPSQPALSGVHNDKHHDEIPHPVRKTAQRFCDSFGGESSQSLPQNHMTAEPAPVVTSAVSASQSLPPKVSGGSSSAGRTKYSVVFSPNDLANMRVAARHDVPAPELYTRYFLSVSFESVVKQYSEVKRELDAEKQRELEAKATQDRIRAEDAQGIPSSSDDQPYTRTEDDLLLAARLEGADIARIARKHFPRRAVQGVITRGKNLYHDLERAVQKHSPGAKLTKDTVIAAIGSERSASLEVQRLVAHESMRESAADRQNEIALKEKENQRLEASRARRLQHTQNLNDIQARARDRESREKLSEHLAQRRADEDAQNQRKYQQALADWKVRAAKARKTHQKLPPEPEPPAASTIGLEIASSQDLRKRTGTPHGTLDHWVDRTNKTPETGHTQPVAGSSTAIVDPTVNPTVNSQTKKSGGLPTPKKSPRHPNPAQSSGANAAKFSKSQANFRDDASVVSANYEDFTSAQTLKQLRKDQDRSHGQPLSVTNAQAQTSPAQAIRSQTAKSQAQKTVNAETPRTNGQNKHQVVAVAPEQASAPKQAAATTQVPAPTRTPAPKQATTATKVPPTVQSKPQKPAAKPTPMATARAQLKSTGSTAKNSKTSKNEAAAPAASRTRLRASQAEANRQPLGKSTQGRIVELSSSEDEGEDDEGKPGARSDSDSEYSLSRIGETADQQRERILSKNQEAMRAHDARSKRRYKAALARIQAKEEARRPVSEPHPVLINARGDTESADEEICRFLDTGLTAPPEDPIKTRPSAPVGSFESSRRAAAAAPKWSQSTLGSTRPPFPSSGRVRSASLSGESRSSVQTKCKTFANTQSTRLNVDEPKEDELRTEYEGEGEGDETREQSLEGLRAYHARIEKVRQWRRGVERANMGAGAPT